MALLTCSKIIPQARGLASALLRRAPVVELPWDVRQRSRFKATDTAGRQLGVFLPRGSIVRGGDVLVAEDGSLIRVVAAPEPVMRITPCPDHGAPFDLMRAAYHLGNRHVSIQLAPECLKIEPDPVLADMLRAMHLVVTPANEPYDPEGGAYGAQASGHGHSHSHSHSHGHSHGRGANPSDEAHGHTGEAGPPQSAA